MNIRPRCREWLPLSTQQLRLRNLQAIHGVNIQINESRIANISSDRSQTLLYYTLHDHPKNQPFYKSEKVAFRRHLNVKWAEIQCPEILKSNVNCVCIKVWASVRKTENFEIMKDVECEELARTKNTKEPMSALTREFPNFQKLPCPTDTLLFNWGVYFSGLIPLSQNIEFKCCKNSLIFEMNDQYFASPERFITECLRGQLALNYQRYSASVPKCSILTPDEFNINSPHVSRSSSPDAVDWQKDLLHMAKTRYIQLNSTRSLVRQSYDLEKLLKLQELQRLRIQIQRESEEITADIKRLSLRCITKEQLLRKRTTSASSSSASNALPYHSMGRTLSLLLAEQKRVDPHQLLKAQELQKELESRKSTHTLLLSARESFTHRITYLRRKLNDAVASRKQLQDWLSKQRRNLYEDGLELKQSLVEHTELCQCKSSVTHHVQRVMYSLCLELRDIYPIERNSNGRYSICGIPFPAINGCTLESGSAQSAFMAENITPIALSSSLGYVAHLVQMISVILDWPLRNPIIHEGSHTRVMDIIKDIPSYTSREFPLYSRSTIPTKAVQYAINLLNQNIAQIRFDVTGTRCDPRATIDNVLKIYSKFLQIEHNKGEVHKRILSSNFLGITRINNSDEIDGSQQHFRHEDQNDNHDLALQMSIKNNEQEYSLSKSHSSVDMNHMMPPTTVLDHHHNVPVFSLTSGKISRMNSIDMQNRSVLITTNQQRNCRSVGSYTDSEEEVNKLTQIKCLSNSDSNLTSLQSGGHHLV